MANKTLKSLTIDETTYDLDYVLRAGDTMTGNLYLNTIADATLATNGLTSNIAPTISAIRDKNGKILCRFDGDVFNDGKIFSTVGARNYDTNGAMVSNAFLQLLANKDGTTRASVYATKPAANTNDTQIASTAFVQDAINRRLPKALTVNISNTTSVSVANNTIAQLDIWTATATGLFIGAAEVAFAPNATGYRFMDVGFEGEAQTGQRVQASTGGVTQLTTPVITRIASGKKVRLRYSQLSGGALNVTLRELKGILIPD